MVNSKFLFDKEVFMNISKLIRSLGIRSTLKGYRYLKYGLELCMRDEDYLLAVYKELYPDIAEYFGTTQDLSLIHI